MRIGWFVKHLWPRTIGGVERQVEALSRWMRAWGHTVELWSSEYPRGWREDLPDGRTIFGLGTRPIPNALWRIGPLCRMLDAVRRLPDRFNVVFSADHLLTAAWVLQGTGTPIIYCPGGTVIGTTRWHFPESQRSNRFWSLLLPSRQYLLAEKICLRRVTGVAAVSTAVKRQMLSVHPGCAGRIRIIHTGYDPELILPKASPPVFTAVCVARLHRIKNIDFLIRAWQKVEFTPRRLVIVGDGEDRGKLQDLVEELGVQGSVEFIGERDDVPRWLAESDVFILPSLYEACPIAVLEAMGTALACITLRSEPGISDVGASGELNIENLTGLLADPRDPADLAAKIEFLARHEDTRLQMGQAGQQRAREKFTWRHAAQQYMEFAEDLLS